MSNFISIVVPALNEEVTIAEFISWCKEGLSKCKYDGEIIIVDSSTDRTPEIAESMGARVVRVPKRGLGRAYIDAIPEIRGNYVIMGDCDCTYDFRELDQFIEKLDEGYEYVMGTRMKGYIEKGAMPKLHQYFGTPLTTWILNLMYGTHFSDIHCGMRAMTLEALKRIHIESQSWEYASEMVLKAAALRLKIAEVPIRFYKDRNGRVSQHKRAGWLSPWLAGWINLKAMFEYNPGFFLRGPGIVAMAAGLILMLFVVAGRFVSSLSTFSVNWLILGIFLAIIGYNFWQMSVLSRAYYGFNKEKRDLYERTITYNRGVISGGLLCLLGFVILLMVLNYYLRTGRTFTGLIYVSLFGVLFLVIGFSTFTFTLLLRMMYKMRYVEEQEKIDGK